MRRPAGTTPARRPRPEHVGKEMDDAIRTFAYPLVEKALRDVLDRSVTSSGLLEFCPSSLKLNLISLAERCGSRC